MTDKTKILNCYAGLGGNRKLWGDDHEVTAVELDPGVADIYRRYFPNDNIIIGDAHQYLIDHYHEFDIIWGSPPCPTHSRLNSFKNANVYQDIEYPDMRLYQEIIFLQKFFYGKYIIENVIPYYKPLIPAQQIGRHLFWANFTIGKCTVNDYGDLKNLNVTQLSKLHEFDVSNYQGYKRKRQILRNCVDAGVGKHIMDKALKELGKSVKREANEREAEQQELFREIN